GVGAGVGRGVGGVAGRAGNGAGKRTGPRGLPVGRFRLWVLAPYLFLVLLLRRLKYVSMAWRCLSDKPRVRSWMIRCRSFSGREPHFSAIFFRRLLSTVPVPPLLAW